MFEYIKKDIYLAYKNFVSLLTWIVIAFYIGATVGVTALVFHFGIEYATHLREQYKWLILLLPIGGAIIAFLYKFYGMEKDRGTNFILVAVRSNEEVSIKMAPLIFISTILTHLFGGSSGREGAALQLGGSISSKIGAYIGLDEKDKRIITMCGMSTAFATLFGTPITAVVFAMEVVTVGVMHYSAIVPCLISALIGASVAKFSGIFPTAFILKGVPDEMLLAKGASVLVLAIGCAVVSILFCTVMKQVSCAYKKYFHNSVIRAASGGLIVLLLTLILGTTAYSGAGMEVIDLAVGGNANPQDAFWKIIFTALTLGAGFKGGEIVPTFFVGATFGNVFGSFLGLNPSFGAGIGIVALFCGVTNCPLTAIILSIELFGAKGLGYYALASGISYMLSGYFGLYSEQKILYSKFNPSFINKNAK